MSTAARSRQHPSGSQAALLSVLLIMAAVVVLAAHHPALSAKAVCFDDNQYLFENQLVRNPSWSSARRFLTEVLKPSTVKGYYQPLTMISLMLDYALAGNADNLAVFHTTSLFLHTANTLLVIVLLYVLFGNVWSAAAVGLLFGLHPLTVQEITWVSERKTVLATFFTLLCLIMYLLHARRPNWKLYAGALLLFVLALLSKPTSIPLPLFLLLLDWWPLKSLNRRTIVEKIPFFVLAAVSAAVTFVSQTRAAWTQLPTTYPPGTIPLVICYDIRFYLNKLLWPVNLSVYYPFPQPVALSNPNVLRGVFTTCVVVAASVISLQRTRALVFALLFLFIGILPTMQIVGFSDVVAANKFVYLPSLGVLISLAALMGALLKSGRPHLRRNLTRTAIAAVVVVAAAAETAAARSYARKWKDTQTLFSYLTDHGSNISLLYLGLADGLVQNGRLDDAVVAYQRCLEISPRNYKALNNLAAVLARQGRISEATVYLERAVEIVPDDFKSRYNLGLLTASQGRIDDALTHLQTAVRIQPDRADAHYNLGLVLERDARIEQALAQYRTALRIDPDFIAARRALDRVQTQMPDPARGAR